MDKQVSVVAISAFEYDGELRTKKSGSFVLDADLAGKYQSLGLVRIVGPAPAKRAEQPDKKPKPAPADRIQSDPDDD